MGNDQSAEPLPALPHEQTNLDLSNQQLHEFPIKIPRDNELISLNISNNFITHIPTKMKKLQKFIMENNNLNSIPSQFEDSFSHMKHLEQLDLSYNKLTQLPDFIYKMPHLKRVELRGNKFSKISTFSDSLKIIDLSKNNFEEIPKLPQSVLAAFYSYNRITHFYAILPEARFIYCTMNRIETVASGISFQYLNTLDFSMNLLTNEKIPSFKVMAPSLEKLDLSFNQLKKFPELPPSLKELDLSYNQLEVIPDIDETLPILDVLKVTNNSVQTVGKLPSSLTSLFLGENQIKSIEKSNLTNLETFQIFSNRLEKPPDLGELKVKDIFFVSNELESFDIEDWTKTRKKESHADKKSDMNEEKVNPIQMAFKIETEVLTRLNLGDNKLKRINPNIFDLPNLIHLNVEKNRLTSLPRLISHSRLLFLNISENPFERLEFDLPMSIITFYCSSCKLTEIPESISECSSLCILHCTDNEIERMPLLPYIEMINASNNRIKKFPDLPRCIQQIDLSMNLIEAIPDEVNEFKNLIEFDLSYNKLSKLPKIENLTALIFLKLSHNENLEGEIDLAPFE